MTYVETPRTDVGNSTYMPNGYGLDDFSAENTFMSPSKKERDLVPQLRNGRGISLKTPRPRAPFGDRRNLPVAPLNGEFTPLLKSVAKKNLQRSATRSGVPETPAFLKNGFKGTDSPALPSATPGVYSEDTGSSVGATDDGTPLPQIASSSAQATPLATVPKRNAEGVLTDRGNMFTLREQENVRPVGYKSNYSWLLTINQIINKIEKENFGLKLKIHFLEESLRKSGPGFNEAALKENTELKVDKVTMHKELARARKTLERTEREVENYRKQLQHAHDQTKRKHADRQILEELESLRKDIASKDDQILQLRNDLTDATEKDGEIEKLKGDIDDLEIDLREKDRLLDDREDEIEVLKDQTKQNADELADAVDEVNTSKRRVLELEQDQRAATDHSAQLHGLEKDLADAQGHIQDLEREVERAETSTKSAQEEIQQAQHAKEKAEQDLEEVTFSSKINEHILIPAVTAA